MPPRELPVLSNPLHYGTEDADEHRENGRVGAAVRRPRDAYRGIPFLATPPWGTEVSAYFFFGGISSGAFTVGSLAMVCGQRWREFGRIGHIVAFGTLLPCPILLVDDLGRPALFHHMLRIFKPSSPMNLGAWTLLTHSGFVGVSFVQALAHADRLPLVGPTVRWLPERLVAAGGLPSALTLGGYTGVLLGTTSIPVWFTSPLLGALFMASSLTSGLGAIAMAVALTSRDSEDIEVIRSLSVQMGIVELAVLEGYFATSGKSARPLMTGKLALELTGAIVATGLAIALDMSSPREGNTNRMLGLAAGAATLVGSALLRWTVVRAGSPSAQDRENALEAMSPSPEVPGWGPHRKYPRITER
jgi:formate-dependent nitrite reductase membrane component NrfD